MSYWKLSDLDFEGKKVLVRVDFNVPIDETGKILDDYRIKIAIPTLRHLLDSNAKQIILVTHLGRPKNNEAHLQTNALAKRASELLGINVAKVDGWGESSLPDEKAVFLENIRFNAAEKSEDEKERDGFGKKLSELADVFVNEAFANLHRAHASMTSIPKYIQGCVGLRVQKELELFEHTLKNPDRPMIAIIGGLKADKLSAINNLLNKVDSVQVAGALAFTLLKAKGYEMGDSKIDSEGLDSLKELAEKILKSDKVKLPVDAVIADKFSADANAQTVPVDQVKSGWLALDLGDKTIENYCKEISSAGTLLWFGPIGVFEFDRFANGTKSIADALAKSKATTIVGGGDSASAVAKLGFFDSMTLVSSGGGASLKLIEGGDLPGIVALEQNKEHFS